MLVALASGPTTSLAQEPGPATPEPATREAAIEQAQAEKDRQLQPYVLSKGETESRTEPRTSSSTASHASVLRERLSGGGFTFGLGYMRHVSPYNTIDVRGSFTFTGYKRTKWSSSRPACSTAAACCRSSADGVKRPRSASTASVSESLETDHTSFAFGDPYGPAHSRRSGRRDAPPSCAAGRKDRSGTRQSPGAVVEVCRHDLYTRTLPGLGAASPTCTRRRRRARLAALPRLRAARQLLRRHVSRLQR